MIWTNLLSGFLVALVGGSFALGAVLLEHSLRERASQKRILNAVLRELGQVRHALERWMQDQDLNLSWRHGGPRIRPHLVVAERQPVEVSELPTAITRHRERVELKLQKLYTAAAAG